MYICTCIRVQSGNLPFLRLLALIYVLAIHLPLKIAAFDSTVLITNAISISLSLSSCTVGSLQANFEQLERKRKLMRLRFAAIKRRRTVRRPRRGQQQREQREQEQDNAMAYETEWLDADTEDTEHNMGEDESNALIAQHDESNSNADDDTSNTSMEAQLSQAPSTSNSLHFLLESTESNNNNSQLAENNNNKVNNGAYHSETTTSTSSSSQANI